MTCTRQREAVWGRSPDPAGPRDAGSREGTEIFKEILLPSGIQLSPWAPERQFDKLRVGMEGWQDVILCFEERGFP